MSYNIKAIENTNVSKYGVYRVGGVDYYNKAEAFAVHVKNGLPVTWHLFEDEINSMNLFQEPTESLETLYAQRAIRLRQDYDHLILYWSGGDDSAKVAQIFIDAGLRVDEVVIRSTHADIRKENFKIGMDPEGSEIELVSIPTAKYLRDTHWPELIITVQDHYSETVIDYIRKNPDWHVKRQSASVDPTSLVRGDLDILVKRWQDMANAGKKIAHIQGKEKPMVRRDSKGFYFRYLDMNHLDYQVSRTLEVGLPHYVEFFFQHPSTMKMQLKQIHLLRRAWAIDPVLPLAEELAGTRAYEDAMAAVLYGVRTIPMTHKFLKARDLKGIAPQNNTPVKISSLYFVKDSDSDYQKIWARGMFELYKSVKPLYNSFRDFFHNGYPVCSTANHYFWYGE